MAGLSEVVEALASRPGVEAVVLTSADGLPIQHAGPSVEDPEALAALAATFARQAARLLEAGGRGVLQTVVLEAERGLAILSLLGEGTWVLLLVAPGTNVGSLLFELRRHRPALAALL